MNEAFLKAANGPTWTPDPDTRGLVWKRGVPYLDFTYQGKRIRYNLEETFLQRCKRLGKPVSQDANGKWIWPQDESDLQFAVGERLANLKPKNP